MSPLRENDRDILVPEDEDAMFVVLLPRRIGGPIKIVHPVLEEFQIRRRKQRTDLPEDSLFPDFIALSSRHPCSQVVA